MTAKIPVSQMIPSKKKNKSPKVIKVFQSMKSMTRMIF